uniref:C2H2-type domain-containing protein n=1 Tax=Amphilophus citrinellus TaxID=61819 RepID=A0A3Q0RWT1_AMPCI
MKDIPTKPESGVPGDAGHNTPQKNFSCSACGKQFVYKQSLKRHIRRNSENGSSSYCPPVPLALEVIEFTFILVYYEFERNTL